MRHENFYPVMRRRERERAGKGTRRARERIDIRTRLLLVDRIPLRHSPYDWTGRVTRATLRGPFLQSIQN